MAPAPDENARLRDGTPVTVSRITPADAPMIEDAFARLSAESRRLRFLTAKPRLSQSELRYLTHVDGHDHEALSAVDPETGQGVGVARFVRDERDPTRAEFAVTVADDWQGRGVATLLLTRLSERAREEGVERLTALVARDNEPMHELLGTLSSSVRTLDAGGDAVEYEVELAPEGLGTQLQAMLRAAASGRLRPPAELWHALRALVPLRVSQRS